MIKREGTPWMPANKFGAGLTGVGINLLLQDVAPMCQFMVDVLGGECVYADVDFAYLRISGSGIILHADHTYADHPYSASVVDVACRGAGVELRFYDIDPDWVQARAQAAGHSILDAATNKSHGLREVFLLGPEGYCFVVSRPLAEHEFV